ncbi:MAG: tRNA adenosine(34) deaminase TadA [Candidatus Anammoxibacter sp.]
MTFSTMHEHFMQHALLEAEKAFEEEEIPVGSVIVYDNRIIARAHNQREMLKDPTAHAEMIAITQAAAYLENWRLGGASIYVTLEPCLMCMGAILESRIDTLVFGTTDNKTKCRSIPDIKKIYDEGQKLNVIPNILEQECKSILQGFFEDKRANPKKRYEIEALNLTP